MTQLIESWTAHSSSTVWGISRTAGESANRNVEQAFSNLTVDSDFIGGR